MPSCAAVNLAMQDVTGSTYSLSNQHMHQDSAHSRIERDAEDIDKLFQFLLEINPFSSDPSLRSISNGLVAHEGANVDDAEKIGTEIIGNMSGSLVVD
jgi:hypothetical protein